MEQNPKTTDSKNFTYTPHTTWVETFDKQPRLLRNSGSASVPNPLTYGPCRPSRLSDYVAYKSRRPGPCLRYGDIEQPNAPQQRIFKQDTSTGLPKRLTRKGKAAEQSQSSPTKRRAKPTGKMTGGRPARRTTTLAMTFQTVQNQLNQKKQTAPQAKPPRRRQAKMVNNR